MPFQPNAKRKTFDQKQASQKRLNINKKELQRQQREMVFFSVPVQDP
jgi:hypothetical protein